MNRVIVAKSRNCNTVTMLAVDRALNPIMSSSRIYRGVPKPAVDFLARNKRALKSKALRVSKSTPRSTEARKPTQPQHKEKSTPKRPRAHDANTVLISKSYLENLLQLNEASRDTGVAKRELKHVQLDSSQIPGLESHKQNIAPPPSLLHTNTALQQVPLHTNIAPQHQAHPHNITTSYPHTSTAPPNLSTKEQWLKELAEQVREKKMRDLKQTGLKEPPQEVYFPFGRPGCGAPIRTESGRVLADLRSKVRTSIEGPTHQTVSNTSPPKQRASSPIQEYFPFGRPGCGAPNNTVSHGVSYQPYGGNVYTQPANNIPTVQEQVSSSTSQAISDYPHFQAQNGTTVNEYYPHGQLDRGTSINTHSIVTQPSTHPSHILQLPTQASHAPQPPTHPSYAPQLPTHPSHAPQPPTHPSQAPQPPTHPSYAPQLPIHPSHAPQPPIHPSQAPLPPTQAVSVLSPREGFGRGAGPYVDKFVQQEMDQRRRKELDYRAELAEQIVARQREKEALRLAKEREEALEEARLAQERQRLNLQYQRELAEKRRKEELAIERHRMLQQGIEEAQATALLVGNKVQPTLSSHSPTHATHTLKHSDQNPLSISSKFNSVIRSPSMLQLQETSKIKKSSRIPVRRPTDHNGITRKVRTLRNAVTARPISPPTLTKRAGQNITASKVIRPVSPPVPTLAKKMSQSKVEALSSLTHSPQRMLSHDHTNALIIETRRSHNKISRSHDFPPRSNSPPVPTLAKKLNIPKTDSQQVSTIPINRLPSCEPVNDDITPTLPPIVPTFQDHHGNRDKYTGGGPSRQAVILEQLAALKKGILSHQSTLDQRVNRIINRRKPNF